MPAAVRVLVVGDHADVRYLIGAIVAGADGVEVVGEGAAFAQLDALAPGGRTS